MGAIRRPLFAVAVIVLLAGRLDAAVLSIPSGASLDLGGGSLDLSCANLSVDGTFLVGSGVVDQVRDVAGSGVLFGDSGTLRVTGDWGFMSSLTLNAGTGTVEFVDGCGETIATIYGSASFAVLRIISQTAKEFRLEVGSTQTIGSFDIQGGGPGNALKLRSTVPGQDAFLSVGTSTGFFVDVDDVDGVGNPILVGAGSVIGPNAMNWLKVIGVPALGSGAGIALGLLLLLGGAGLRIGIRGFPPGRS